MIPTLSAPAIPAQQLAWLILPLLATWFVLRRARTGSQSRLIHGAVRGAVQLSVVGYVLVPLLDLQSAGAVLLVLCVICTLAAAFSLGVLAKGPGLRILPFAVVSILPVVIGLVLFALGLVVPGTGVLEARYAITLTGMLAGNAMNAVALAGDRFLSSLGEQRAAVEQRLLLGASGREAVAPLVGAAVRAAVTPSLNGLIAVGLVSFPGMMTGQVMAGEAPLPAAIWQMLIMALWVTCATLSSRLFLHLLAGIELHGHRIASNRMPSRRRFEVPGGGVEPAPPPEVFDQRPPEEKTRGFIGDPPE